MTKPVSAALPSSELARNVCAETSRWISRALRRVVDPKAEFERTVRRIVADRQASARTQEAARSPVPRTDGLPPRPPRGRFPAIFAQPPFDGSGRGGGLRGPLA